MARPRIKARTMAQRLQAYISRVVDGGFQDPLDDDALLEYCKEYDPNVKMSYYDRTFIYASGCVIDPKVGYKFSDGSSVELDPVRDHDPIWTYIETA